MRDISLRPVDITNQQEMTKLYKAIRMAEDASRVPHWRKDRILDKLETDTDRAYMFQQGARILGAARISADPDFRYIKDFAIFKKYQGKGYGTAAFNKLLDEVPGEGPISLAVGKDNDIAQKLYSNAGFKKVHQYKSTGNWEMQKDAGAADLSQYFFRTAVGDTPYTPGNFMVEQGGLPKDYELKDDDRIYLTPALYSRADKANDDVHLYAVKRPELNAESTTAAGVNSAYHFVRKNGPDELVKKFEQAIAANDFSDPEIQQIIEEHNKSKHGDRKGGRYLATLAAYDKDRPLDAYPEVSFLLKDIKGQDWEELQRLDGTDRFIGTKSNMEYIPENVKTAAMSAEEKQLRRLARPYYPAVGRRSWEHVNQVMRNAEMITQGMENRPLTLQEKAAIYFHDCAIRQRGTGKEHGKYGRETAIPLLLATGIFNDKQLDEIGTAILEHDTLNATGKKFSNKTGEVLASGDANTPDLPWLLNKFYNWQLQNNPDKENWPADIYETAINEFGNKSTEKFPALYNKFHGDRVQKLRDQIDSMSQDEMWDMVQKYRKKHRLDETDERLGTPPWFQPV